MGLNKIASRNERAGNRSVFRVNGKGRVEDEKESATIFRCVVVIRLGICLGYTPFRYLL